MIGRLTTIMNIENKGQYPSFDLFVKLITLFDVSVDQFIHADGDVYKRQAFPFVSGCLFIQFSICMRLV